MQSQCFPLCCRIDPHRLPTIRSFPETLSRIEPAVTRCHDRKASRAWATRMPTLRTIRNAAIAWDGLGRDPHVPVKKRTRTKTEEPKLLSEAGLAELRPYSPEWIALRSAIDAEEQARISKLMVICTGCEVASNDANRTSPLPSPAPNRRTTEAR